MLGVHVLTLDGVDTRLGDGLLPGIRAVIAAEERRRISERTIRGRIATANDKGGWFGPPVPFGHCRARDHVAKITRIEVEHDEAEIILRATALIVDERRSPHETAMILNQEGYRSRGVPWRSDRPPLE